MCIKGRRVTCTVELNLGSCQLASTSHIPIFGRWSVRVGVVQLRNKLTIGVTGECNL